MIEKTEFLPFHAINEFMRPDFRLSVIRETLTAEPTFAEPFANLLNNQIKSNVTVPGFRNSNKAPLFVKVLPTNKAFEKNPGLVGAVLSCWAEAHSELRQQVLQLLTSRGWKILEENDKLDAEELTSTLINEWPIFPIKFNRTKLPGFYTHWPKGEDFDALYTNFSDLFPGSDASIDKVSLMVVWLSMRLPYQVDGVDEKPAA